MTPLTYIIEVLAVLGACDVVRVIAAGMCRKDLFSLQSFRKSNGMEIFRVVDLLSLPKILNYVFGPTPVMTVIAIPDDVYVLSVTTKKK